jgi:hypothetical protein
MAAGLVPQDAEAADVDLAGIAEHGLDAVGGKASTRGRS